MKEYIERQAAIDAVLAVIPYDEYWMEQVEKAIGNLPSTQPEVAKDTNVPINDCISRQAAIDLIESIETERLKGNVGLIYAPAIKGLQALPSAQPEPSQVARDIATIIENEKDMRVVLSQPEPHWIPVSERLPEDEQFVLATYKTTDRIHVCQYHEDGSRNQWYSLNDMCRAHNNVVLAWMPLPEPYREEGENR